MTFYILLHGAAWDVLVFHVLKGRNLDWYVKDNRIVPFDLKIT